jgi:penicillin amidase
VGRVRRVGLVLAAILAPLVVLAVLLVLWIANGVATGVSHVEGRVDGLAVHALARIVRDDRGIPHIRAASLHDAFFAQGYATASDRLFQMDLTRRFVRGTLGEIVGGSALPSDRNARIIDVGALVDAAYAHLAPADRDAYDAFAAGVNAAATHEPQPPEYRAIGYSFRPWTPQDSLAVGLALAIDLDGTWNAVTMYDAVQRTVGPAAAAAFFSPSDPAWDTPTTGGAPAPIPSLPALPPPHAVDAAASIITSRVAGLGSNAWAAGATRTRTQRALLANDPHLERSIPGIWHLVDIEAPGFHVAGATFAGMPGVILGHNDAIAWGATNGTVASPRVYRETFTSKDGATYRVGNDTLVAASRTETFFNRIGNPEHRTYLRTRHGFVLQNDGLERDAVQWDLDLGGGSPAASFLALDRARSLEDAWRVLAAYPGPPQNFALVDVRGRAAYALAGHIPLDAAWGLATFDGPTTAPSALHFVPFAQLPQVAPSRSALVVTANNRPYAAGYPYRLSPAFEAPYRAAEIRARLRALPAFDVASFAAIQADTRSLGEGELARFVVAAVHRTKADADPDIASVARDLATFDGRMDSSSVAATLAQRIRVTATGDLIRSHLPPDLAQAYLAEGPAFVTLLRALRAVPHGWFPNDDRDAFLVAEVRRAIQLWGGLPTLAQPYGDAYAVTALHPLAGFGYHGWDGPRVPGAGGSYAPAVQGLVLGQSFRAIWDAGNWDAGGIDIPLGESGEPGSPHYRDLAPRFTAHALTPLPWSDAAVARAARGTLVLAP